MSGTRANTIADRNPHSMHAPDSRVNPPTCTKFADEPSIVSVTERRTSKKTEETAEETRYFITSLPPDPEPLAAAIRAHWSIENNLHWTLDVAFREDESRMRKDHSARNLAMIRRAVLNIMRKDPMQKSIKRKRFRASFDREYRTQLLAR